MRKIIITLLLVTGLIVAGKATTSAISPIVTVKPTCNNLTVYLSYYQQPRTVRVNNRVIVTIDGISSSQDFGARYTGVYSWDPTVPHNYTVTVDANRIMGYPTLYDSVTSGTFLPCSA